MKHQTGQVPALHSKRETAPEEIFASVRHWNAIVKSMQHTSQENVENLWPARIRIGPSEPFRARSQTVDLGSARLIVCVGRGIKDAENIPIVQELATLLGA